MLLNLKFEENTVWSVMSEGFCLYVLLMPFIRGKEFHTGILVKSLFNSMCIIPLYTFSL